MGNRNSMFPSDGNNVSTGTKAAPFNGQSWIPTPKTGDFNENQQDPRTAIPGDNKTLACDFLNWCQYRLPCGICSKLGYMCPMIPQKMEITC